MEWHYNDSLLCFRLFYTSSVEKVISPHSSTFAWKIPWAEEPARLQSMGSRRVGQDWATSLSLFTFMHWRRKWQPTPVFLPGESQGQGSLVAAIYGVTQSRTRLKRLSSSSSSSILAHLKSPRGVSLKICEYLSFSHIRGLGCVWNFLDA